MRIDYEYAKLIKEILNKGYYYKDTKRNVMCKQISSYNLKIPLRDQKDIHKPKPFPILSLKKINYKNIFGELIWFMMGDPHIKYLIDNNINIWNKDVYNYYCKRTFTINGLLSYEEWLDTILLNSHLDTIKTYQRFLSYAGQIYPAQWRKTKYINGIKTDQLQQLVDYMINDPMNRRLIVNSWDYLEKDKMSLPPCHWSFEIIMRPLSPMEKMKLVSKHKNYKKLISQEEYKEILEDTPNYGFTLKWHQRSVDTYLGLPYNITSYATLAIILEQLTGHLALEIEGDLSNVHLYENSWDAALEISNRVYKISSKKENCPVLQVNTKTDFSSLNNFINSVKDDLNSFIITNYNPLPNIPVEMLAPI